MTHDDDMGPLALVLVGVGMVIIFVSLLAGRTAIAVIVFIPVASYFIWLWVNQSLVNANQRELDRRHAAREPELKRREQWRAEAPTPYQEELREQRRTHPWEEDCRHFS